MVDLSDRSPPNLEAGPGEPNGQRRAVMGGVLRTYDGTRSTFPIKKIAVNLYEAMGIVDQKIFGPRGGDDFADVDGTPTPGRQARLTFSKDPIDKIFSARNPRHKDFGKAALAVDLGQSTFPLFARCNHIFAGDVDERLSPERMTGLRERLAEHEARFNRGEPVLHGASGEVYWLAFLLGLVAFDRDGQASPANPYRIWWRRSLASGLGDPGLLHYLKDEAAYDEALGKRLSHFALMLRSRAPVEGDNPIIAFCATLDHPSLTHERLKKLKLERTGEIVCVPTLDGHHRIFMHLLLELHRGRAVLYWDPGFLNGLPIEVIGSNYLQRMLQYAGGRPVDEPAF